MKKTIFITGCDSGIGEATANYFLEKGWNVFATYYSEESTRIPDSERSATALLDVKDAVAVKKVAADAVARFGRVDVLVNNAGYGLLGPFELMDEQAIKEQFDVNVFGTIRTTQAFLPHFRKYGGHVIAISSMLGKISLPFFSPYAATKHAIEGLFESLYFELAPLNIRLTLIEPGTIKTDFFKDIREPVYESSVYENPYKGVIANIKKRGDSGAPPEDVAREIYRAVTKSASFRITTDTSARLLLALHKLPLFLYRFIIRTTVK